MSRNSLDDPSATVDRRFLRSCASVCRQSGDRPAEFRGLLTSEPRVGAPLVLILDGHRQLRTTLIRRIEPGPKHAIYVETANNHYLVRRLFPTQENR